MKKTKKTQNQSTSRFGGKIRQMHQAKMVLVNFNDVRPFIDACAARGITLGIGSAYRGNIIFYEK